MNYLTSIRDESARSAAALALAAPGDRVPTCPGWTAADLLWHLTEVQWFWGTIVRDRLDDPDAAEGDTPARPDDYLALLDQFGDATTHLLAALAITPAETPIWTWTRDKSVGFVLRHQAQEALMHRLDAEAAIGHATDVDPELAADGIDEILDLVHGDLPAWSTFTPSDATGVLEATDVEQSWSIVLGRFTGTSTASGKIYDMDAEQLVPSPLAAEPSFGLRGRAADLGRWLWGRGPLDALDLSGDHDAFARLEGIIEQGVQ